MTETLKHETGEAQIATGPAVAEPEAGRFEGAASTETLQGQATTTITPPPPGQTVVLRPQPGDILTLNANPADVRIAIEGKDVILAFDLDGDGQPDSQVVLENFVTLANLANPPALVVGGQAIAADVLVGAAQALTSLDAGAPTLETAADAGTEGTGATKYDDNLGEVIDLLVAQGVIPPVFLQFGLIEREEIVLFEESNEPPVADPVLTPAERGELPADLVTALNEAGGAVIHSEMVTIAGPNLPGSVQYVFFTLTEPSAVTITTDGPTIDPQIHLFIDDGSLDAADSLATDDDDGTPAGSFSNSVIDTGDEIGILPAGNYVVAVSDFSLDVAEAVAGLNGSTDLTGDVTVTIALQGPSPDSVVFFKQLNVDGSIGDDDSGVIADFGGADAETSLENLVFTLQSNPTFGQLILVTSGGTTSYLTPGDTYTSEDTVWWIATEAQIADFLAQPGAPEFLPNVDFLYSVTDEAGASATAPVTITLPPPQPPRTAIGVFQDDCLNEDTESKLLFNVSPTDGASKISQIVISGFPTGDAADAWQVDASSVDIVGYTLGVDYTASYDALTGNLTITFVTASFSLGEAIDGTVDVTPNPDSDVDRTLTIEATAINGAGSATDSESSVIPVDADADGEEGSASDDGDGFHLSVSASASDSDDDGSTFQPDEIGTLSITATFDDFTDGSETHTIVVKAPAGFTILGVVGDLPAGVTLTDNVGSVWTFDVETLNGLGSVTLDLQIQNASAQDGTADFKVLAVAEETSTDDIECEDGGEGGIDPVPGDNVAVAEDTAAVTVAVVTPPTVALTLPERVECIEEDSTTSDGANQVTLTVTPAGDDEITQIVLSGFQSGWTYDLSGLDTDGGGTSVTVTDNGDGTVTIAFSPASNAIYSGSFAVEPPADSDVDHPTITATATVVDPADPALTTSGNATLDIHVDANADAGPGATGGTDDGDADVLSISIDAIADSGDTGSSFQTGESGAVTVTASFDDYQDGSETHSFTLTAPSGFEIDGINTASLPLPTGVTFELAPAGSAITFSMPTDTLDGLGSLTVTLDVTNVSATEGSPLFTASAMASETTTGDEECDPSDADNIATVSDEQSVTVAGVASPTVSINLENEATYIKEDSLNNLAQFSAATGDASDELTTVVITFPAGVDASEVDFTTVAADSDVSNVDVDDNGGAGPVVVTITFGPDVTAFSGSFTLDAPVADSDEDLGSISIVANVRDQVDNGQTDSANANLQIDVDAVLDQALDPGLDSNLVEIETAAAQTIGLGLNASLISAGFMNDPPLGGDSGSGGTDDDGSELISAVLALDAALPVGVTLSSTAGTVTQDLANDPSGKTYVISGGDLKPAIDGLEVDVPGSFEGTISGTVTATSKEANTPPGDVVPASGEEPDTADNVKVLSADFSVTVNDGVDPRGDSLNLTVDEKALDLVQDGSDLQAGTTFGTNAGSTAETDSGNLTFDAGGDPIVDIAFGETAGIVVEDEGGNPITVDWAGSGTDQLVGKIGGVTVIVLSLSGDNTAVAGGTANVTVTATLTDAFPHDLGNSGNVSISSIAVDADDDDGDTGTGTVNVTVLDDAPNDISPDKAVIGSNGSFPVVVTQDLDFFDNVGADKPGDVTFLASLDGTALEDSGGDPVTSDGQPIVLALSGDGHTLTGYVESGANTGFQPGEDTVILTAQLDPDATDEGADEYSITLLGPVDTGQQFGFDDFSGIGGGQAEFFPLSSSTNPGLMQDLLITGTVPGTSSVNTDNDDVGTGDQWLNNDTNPATGEILRLDYVTNVGGNEDDINTLTYGTHYTVNDTGFRINQLQGSKTTTRTALVRVYDEDDDPKGNDFSTDGAGDPAEQDDITQARITFFSEGILREVVATADGPISAFGRTFTFSFAGDAVVIAGLLEGDQVFISTLDGFNQMEIQNTTSGNSLGIALDNFLVSTSQAGEPIDLSLGVEVTDQDGDTSTGTIDVTVLPQQVGTAGADSLTATASGSDLVGGAGNDTLAGSDANDKLQGGDDADTIGDGEGNDISIGGNGADTINLSTDSDTDVIIFDALSEAGDTVNGFDVPAPNLGGAGGDIIDIVDLMDSGTDFAGTTLAEAEGQGYVQLFQNGGNTEVRVDANGGGDNFSILVVTLVTTTALDLNDNIIVD